ncbi:tyrosine-protein phosphatase non-receptor type 23-like [Centruroides sculpturatus]|uniref:tyrosine-protein phosphatase non-receptor type 23-like n=1 Tax=Centruroides sculpturatus TaxID=218467 RepID=UPI000C6D0EB4|nr:tyrosine-protein phosphatase non-receptor type 23-like [Centruroides sculpturatus]
MKIACTHFQCAAWAFQHIRENYAMPKGCDMSHDLLTFYINVMLAQAQECILEKSMLDSRKSPIIAKVAAQVVEYYQTALATLLSGSSSVESGCILHIVGSKIFKSWKKFVEFKISYYGSISHLYMGNQAEEQQKMGDRVAWYQSAFDKLEEAIKISKTMERDDLNEALSFTMDVIGNKQNIAKKENDFVYHEKVPAIESLPEVKGASLVKGIPFSPTDPDVSGPDIFARLVPIEAHEASSMYSEEKAKILRTISAKVEDKDQELMTYLSSLQLDSNLLSPQTDQIPQELLEKCAAMSVRQSAIDDLSSLLKSLMEVSQEVEDSLKQTYDILKQDEQKEQLHQESFGKRAPSMIIVELTKECSRYQEAHKRAEESNTTLQKVFNLHINNLKLLTGPMEELKASLPSVSSMEISNDDGVVKELKRLLVKVEEMRRQRQMLETQLRNALQSDDITTQLVMKDRKNDLQSVFEDELKKHNQQVALLEQNLVAQDNILHALTQANARYANIRKATTEILNRREAMISSLINSYEAYEELLAKAQKGLEFYHKLQTNVSRVLTRARSVTKVQDEERAQISEVQARKASSLREAMISSLINSYEAYEELLAKAQKGLEFYHKLQTNVSRVLTRARSVTKVQDEERAQISEVQARKAGRTFDLQTTISGSSVPSVSSVPKLKDYLPFMTNRAAAVTSTTTFSSQPSVPIQSDLDSSQLNSQYPAVSAIPYSNFQPELSNIMSSVKTSISEPAFYEQMANESLNTSVDAVAIGVRPAPVGSEKPITAQCTNTTHTSPYTVNSINKPISADGSYGQSQQELNYNQYDYSYYQQYSTNSTLPTEQATYGHMQNISNPQIYGTSNQYTYSQVGQNQTNMDISSYHQYSTGSDVNYQNPIVSNYNQNIIYSSQPQTTTSFSSYPQTSASNYMYNYTIPQISSSATCNYISNQTTLTNMTAEHSNYNQYNAETVKPSQYITQQIHSNEIPAQNMNYQTYQLPSSGSQQLSVGQISSTYCYGPGSQISSTEQYSQDQYISNQFPSNYINTQTSTVYNHSVFPQPNNINQIPNAYSQQISYSETIPPVSVVDPIDPVKLPQKDSNVTEAVSTKSTPVVSPAHSQKNEIVEKDTTDILSSSVENKLTIEQQLPILKPKVISTAETLSRTDSVEQERTQLKDPLSDNSTLEKFISEVEKFEKFVEGLTRKSLLGPTALDQKWKELMDTQDRESRKLSISVARCYPIKNRYPDIMPYDSNRVALTSLRNDYINASFVKNITQSSVPFIVTQSPLPSTYVDFWSMIWEQQTEIVVCLLSNTELKSQIYWPVERGNQINHGPFTLSLQSTKEKQTYVESILSIIHNETRMSRVVIHLQFTAFPINGVPASPSHLLQFIAEVHNYHRQQRNLARPVVVHCSGGIGRSGAFCLLSASIKEMACGRTPFDISQIAARMSQQRKFLIQEKDHLKFCYDAVLYHAQDILMKRGILTNKAKFEDKLPSSQHTHIRHPSEDFVLGAEGLAKLQSGTNKVETTDKTEEKGGKSEYGTEEKVAESSHSDPISREDKSVSEKIDAHSDTVIKPNESRSNSLPTPAMSVPSTDRKGSGDRTMNEGSPSITSLLDPAKFTLDDSSPGKRRITKDSFNTKSNSLDCQDPSDPLSQLDPLWSLKKTFSQQNITQSSVPFIVTQSPLPSTYVDFWSMIWEQQTEIVVCLLSNTELKSQIYWPVERGNQINHGPFTLSLQSTKEKQTYVESILSIIHNETRMSRVVIHLQFTAFPINGVPASPSHLLQFIAEVHNYHRQQRNLARPVVVHCSGGIGRSGAFCLLSASIKEMACGRTPFDISQIAARMSQQRKFLIQEKDHLKFCYDAVLYHAQDILMKRGILTNKAKFEDKLPSSQHTHIRHPSEDFVLGAEGLAKLQSGTNKVETTDKTEEKGGKSEYGTEEKVAESSHSDPISREDKSVSEKIDAHSDTVIKPNESRSNSLPTPAMSVPSTDRKGSGDRTMNEGSPSITSLLDPAKFTLDDSSPGKRRITKDSFNTKSNSLDCQDPSDPLSQLDPLWSLKKT